ncbi:MAG: hypothetical protein IIU44_01705, partial [Spirochaetales bacterium]|nr:hypothetical protein [Spirochaetales bacterium]
SLRAPYYLLTSGTDNSLAASLEILTWLNMNELEGEVLHGDCSYIAARIKAIISGKGAGSSGEEVRLGTFRKADLGGRYAVVGKPSDWLIASVPDYEEVREKLGTELIDVPMRELIDGFSNEKPVSDIRDGLDFGSSERLVLAVRGIREKYALDGLTIRCFDLLDSIHTTGCLSLAHLNSEGLIGCCEGDIMSMLSMAVVRKVTGQSSFQANPSRIDPVANRIVLAHCTLPFDMVDSFRYDTHFESGIGVAVKGEMREQPVTILRLSRELGSYWCAEGTIIRNLDEKTLCRTQIEVELDNGYQVSDLLKNPCGNHHIVFYGRHRSEIASFLG